MRGEIRVSRKWFTDKSSIGELSINGKFVCYTLEDKDRGLTSDMPEDSINKAKVYGVTAIPTGSYDVIIDYSNHFKKNLPHILNVKGFEGIRIHPGNTDTDSLGCILVGTKYTKDSVSNSKIAFDILLLEMAKYSDLRITISKITA